MIEIRAVAQPLTETGAGAVDSDPDARLGRLIRKQFGFVWRLARCIGLSQDEVNAAVQDVFSAAAQRIGDIRPGNERAFLFSTTLHVVARVRRNRGEHAVVGAGAAHPESLDEAGQARETLGGLLSHMPLELRVVFVLREIEQFASIEIAEIIGIPLSTVTTRLAQAQTAFATQLESQPSISLSSLVAAARAEQAPDAALARAVASAGVKATRAEGGSKAGAGNLSELDSTRGGAAARRRSPLFLAASWLALGWLVGLIVVSAIWALRDASTTTAVPASVAH